jgi:cbb3-type cytochrome oxidase maturation protein
MIIVFFLIGVSMLVALGFLLAFAWAHNSGQFDDDYTPAIRILYDDPLKQDDLCQHQTSPNSPKKK